SRHASRRDRLQGARGIGRRLCPDRRAGTSCSGRAARHRTARPGDRLLARHAGRDPMPVTRGDAVGLTQALVAVDSRNPSLVPGAPGEGAVASLLAGVLHDWGCEVEIYDVAPGRPNVIARVGRPHGRSLMFNGHLDVVDVAGMTHAPFDAIEREGAIWG